MKPKRKPEQVVDEAYKHLTGSPSLTGVSEAAKGQVPPTDEEQQVNENESKTENMGAEQEPSNHGEQETPREDSSEPECHEIDEAYAHLFQALADILRSK